MTAALSRWACFGLCYLAFAGTLSRAEAIAAVLTGAFATLLSLGVRAKGERRLALRGEWPAALARLGWLLVHDTGRVGAVLMSALFRARHGHLTSDRDMAVRRLGSGAGHRAVTALLASLTPDSMALETDDEAIAVHRLSRSESAHGGRHAP